MSNTVKLKKTKLKKDQKVNFEIREPKFLSLTDSRIKRGKSIQIDKQTFQEYEKESEPHSNKKIGFLAEAFIGEAAQQDFKFEYKKELPFEFIKSPTGSDFPNTKSNLKIINNLIDDEAMQGPWVKEYVGGFLHRRNKFNSTQKRIEAYEIKENSLGLIVGPTSNSPLNYRRSAGSPSYNVANHKGGNYSKNYEIVTTSGRKNNNRYLVDNHIEFINRKPIISNYVFQFFNFNNITREESSHIIVNRFSCPGSPESAGSLTLDHESEEFSVYNTVNYRNRIVRDSLDWISSQPADRFGARSSSESGFFHKTHRNTRRFIGQTGNEFKSDNFFVNHSIPSNDFGYSWVTRSSEDSVYDFLSKNSNFPYQHVLGNYSGIKSDRTINFLSKSLADKGCADSGGNIDNNDQLTFSSLNLIVNHQIKEDENLKTYTSGNLNQQITNAHGPYGWPTWRQIRNSYNPIVRKLRNKNSISIVYRGDNFNVKCFSGTKFNHGLTVENNNTITEDRKIQYYSEPSVSERFYPLKASVHFFENVEQSGIVLKTKTPEIMPQQTLEKLWNDSISFHSLLIQGTADNLVSDSSVISLEASVQSNISMFANEDLTIDLNMKEENIYQDENFDKISSFLLDTKNLIQNNVIRQLSYQEVIYPKEVNSHRKISIDRDKYKIFGWSSKRENRSLILSGNINYSSPIINSETQKIFVVPTAIEEESNFVKSFYNSYDIVDLNSTGTAANILSSSHIVSSEWVLDSRKEFTEKPTNITSSYFTEGDSFLSNRDQGSRGEGILQNDYSIFALGYNGLRGAPPIAAVYNRRIPQQYGSDVYLAGEALWEPSGSNNFGSFYENYSEFSKDLKYFSRGYSLVPEFRMSNFIEKIYESDDFETASTPENFLELTGTLFNTSTDSESNNTFFKTFSNSEFMKYFKPVYEVLNDSALGMIPSRLTLKCKANLKLLPYRGFYPAERAVQISEIFSRNYFHKKSYLSKYIENSAITKENAEKFLNLRISNAKSQVSKPFFSPGVLFNSIKSGLAVDYPIFSSSIDNAKNYILENNVTSSIVSFSNLGLTSTTCFTGSEINSTLDEGIPRLKGQVSKRITIEDLLEPERLIGQTIFDNEPHPSASLIYGSAELFRVLERPSTFGNLNRTEVKEKNAIDFNITKESFANAMRPFKSAVNNFAAETVKFFLKDEKMQTHVSDAVEPYLKSGINYKMRVYVNNQDVMMYDRHSAFGPPVDDGDIPRTTFVTQSNFAGGGAAVATVTFTGLSNSSINASEIQIADYDNTIRQYKFINGYSDNPAAAVAEITFDLGASSLNNSELTIQDTNSKNGITYLFTTDSFAGSTGSVYKNKTVVFMNASDSSATVANSFRTALASSNGHGSTISSSYNSSSGKVLLTQSVTGPFGNIAIVGSGKFSASSNRVIGFINGSFGKIFNTGELSGSSGKVVVQVQTASTPSALASSLQSALTSSNGHGNSIISSVVGNLLKLEQNNSGSLGNREITGTGQMTGGNITGFSAGSDPTGISFLSSSVTIQSGSHGFLPYVPPFLDPGSRPYAEISFTPSDSRNYSIPDIIENSNISYYNLAAPSSAQTTTNYVNAMSLSASVDLKKYVSLYSDNFNFSETGDRIAKKENKKYRWVIQPKWETPVMDFSDSSAAALNLSNNQLQHVSGSPWKERNIPNYYDLLETSSVPYLTASTGMWHQSGSLINQGDLKGYYLTIESGQIAENTDGDLARELGFVRSDLSNLAGDPGNLLNSKKIGVFAKEKQISESIVAIPYFLQETNRIRLFDINSNEFAKARSYNNKIKNNFSFNLQKAKTKEEILEIEKDYSDWFESVGHDSVSSIAYQLRMMDKYILPPHFDFLKNESVRPHVIYFFQFKSLLSETDLARVWQNLYPKSHKGAGSLKESKVLKNKTETDTQYITGFLDTTFLPTDLEEKSNYENYEFFLEKNVRWLVFKVKYKGKNSLSKLKNNSIPKFKEDLESVNGILIEQPLATSITEKEEENLFEKYSYNWPYDYFSLIENIKLESKVDFFSPVSGVSPISEAEQPLVSRSATSQQGVDTDIPETQIIVEDSDNIDVLSNLVIRQEIKSDETAAPSPPNVFILPISSGYQLKTNSESIYVNGVLQVAGSSMDYIISGNIITFNYDILDGDSIYATYIRE